MIRVISHGNRRQLNMNTNGVRAIKCVTCKCVFLFDKNEVTKIITGQDCVRCPECGCYTQTLRSYRLPHRDDK